jgi:hypothetical protein
MRGSAVESGDPDERALRTLRLLGFKDDTIADFDPDARFCLDPVNRVAVLGVLAFRRPRTVTQWRRWAALCRMFVFGAVTWLGASTVDELRRRRRRKNRLADPLVQRGLKLWTDGGAGALRCWDEFMEQGPRQIGAAARGMKKDLRAMLIEFGLTRSVSLQVPFQRVVWFPDERPRFVPGGGPRDVLRGAIVITLSTVADHLRNCAREECRAPFLRRGRKAYCSASCSQAKRSQRWDERHPGERNRRKNEAYAKRIRAVHPKARIQHPRRGGTPATT